MTDVRKGMPDPMLSFEDFSRRYDARFEDPAFDDLRPELEKAMRLA